MVLLTCQSQMVLVRRDRLEFDVTAWREAALRSYDAAVDRLAAFARARFDLEWSQEEAEAAPVAFLAERTIEVLGAFVDGRANRSSRRW